MKKIISVLLTLCLIFSISSCGLTGENIAEIAQVIDEISSEKSEKPDYNSQGTSDNGLNLIEEDATDKTEKNEQAEISETEDNDDGTEEEETSEIIESIENDADAEDKGDESALDETGYYYDLESVVPFLDTYDRLPDNFITKDEAASKGWSGGSTEKYEKGAAIGGDRFGNREGLLPKASGRSYTECDIDTNGKNSRGAKRLVFSNDGLYFYTDDHYETFNEVYIVDGTVEIKK